MFGMPGGGEWIVVLVVAVLIFGKRLPEVGKSFGKTITEFKKGLRDVQDEVESADRRLDESTAPQTAQAALPAASAAATPSPQVTTEEHHVDHV